jgi:hypothetical protein
VKKRLHRSQRWILRLSTFEKGPFKTIEALTNSERSLTYCDMQFPGGFHWMFMQVFSPFSRFQQKRENFLHIGSSGIDIGVTIALLNKKPIFVAASLEESR